MQALGERMTLVLSTPLIAGGLVISALATDWPQRTYGGVLVLCASMALAVPWRQLRGLAFGIAALAAPILGTFVK